MRALSIRQPWAWAILYAGKNVENRTWNTKFRGPFLIHASKTYRPRDYDIDASWIEQQSGVLVPSFRDLSSGGIVGSAGVMGVISPGISRGLWHEINRFGFVLVDAKPLPFRPYKGTLSWFEVNDV